MMKSIIAVLIAVTLMPTKMDAQLNFGTRGPANLDTSKLAHIYILRDGKADTTVDWVSVWTDDNLIKCISKAYKNKIYRINTKLTGRHFLRTFSENPDDSIELVIEPSKNYYLEISAQSNDKGRINAKLKIIDSANAEERIRNFNGKVIDSYGVIPLLGSIDLLADVFKDTINWIANENYIYRFRPINSWECISRGTDFSLFCFFDYESSGNFFESGRIMYFKKHKLKSVEDLVYYTQEELVETHYEGNVFATIKMTTKPIETPEGILYACMNSYEGLNIHDTTELKSQIYSRSVTIVFHWKDKNGKPVTAALQNNEKGLQKEVHSIKELEEELLACWSTFQLISLDSLNAEVRKAAP